MRDMSGPPNFWSEEMIRTRILEPYSYDSLYGGIEKPYDADSIMHYAFPSSWVKGGQGTAPKDDISEGDKAFIAKLYPSA